MGGCFTLFNIGLNSIQSRFAPAACWLLPVAVFRESACGGCKDTTTGPAIPLLPPDKRRVLANFCDALAYSKPAANHFGSKKACMRQRVACGTCALVDWIDSLFPCYLFAECPDNVKPKPSKNPARAMTNVMVTRTSLQKIKAPKRRTAPRIGAAAKY